MHTILSSLLKKLKTTRKPTSLTLDGWMEWHKTTKKEHPIWYFFHETLELAWHRMVGKQFENIFEFIRYVFPRGISNLIRWTPIIWKDRDFDWYYLATVMEYKLNRMADYEEKYGHHTDSPRTAREERICATLLRRLLDDDYEENAGLIISWPDKGLQSWAERKRIYDQADRTRKNDQAYLGKMIGRKLRSWWD